MAGVNKLTVEIYGNKYPIRTREETDYVLELAGEIDNSVREIMTSNTASSINEALVLVALSYLDGYKKSESGADHLRSQIAEYLEDAAKARMEASEARKEIAKLERQLSGNEKKQA